MLVEPKLTIRNIIMGSNAMLRAGDLDVIVYSVFMRMSLRRSALSKFRVVLSFTVLSVSLRFLLARDNVVYPDQTSYFT